jgi:hypothetical protein
MSDLYRRQREDAIIRSLGWQKAYYGNAERPSRPTTYRATSASRPLSHRHEDGKPGIDAGRADASVECRVQRGESCPDGCAPAPCARDARSAPDANDAPNSRTAWDDTISDSPEDRWADDGGPAEGGDF